MTATANLRPQARIVGGESGDLPIGQPAGEVLHDRRRRGAPAHAVPPQPKLPVQELGRLPREGRIERVRRRAVGRQRRDENRHNDQGPNHGRFRGRVITGERPGRRRVAPACPSGGALSHRISCRGQKSALRCCGPPHKKRFLSPDRLARLKVDQRLIWGFANASAGPLTGAPPWRTRASTAKPARAASLSD